MESLVVDKKQNIFINESETVEEDYDKDKLDEDLITAVKNRSALYDFRLPVKRRGRKQKDELWNEVSVYLKDLYTSTEAEKKWNYLRDCYRKARNILKKRQNIQQKSGSAGTPNSIMPSFRYYHLMTFLNNTLEHRQTVTSLKSAIDDKQTLTFTSARANSIEDVDNLPYTNNDTVESGSTSSYSISTPVESKKRKKSNLDECEKTLIETLKETKESSPIDGFVLRLAEGLRRLSYKQRSKLEIELLTRLYEIEETEGI